MQTFAEWLEAQLSERGWNAAGLTDASRTAEDPRGLDSGLISRWRRRDAQAVVPTQVKSLTRLARAFGIPEAEVYRAAGLQPADASPIDARAIIDARRRAMHEDLEAWLTAVGPEYEQDYWNYLKRHGDSSVDLIRRLKTAVSNTAAPAVSDAVSERPKRGRRRTNDDNSSLGACQHATRLGHNALRQQANALQAA